VNSFPPHHIDRCLPDIGSKILFPNSFLISRVRPLHLPLLLPSSHSSLTGVMDDYRSSPDQLKNHSAKEACLVALAAVANVPNSSLHTFHIANTHLFLLFRSSKRRSHTAIKSKGSSSLMSSQNFLYDICTSLSCTTLLTPLL
jgi:hypothetical protein